VRNWSEIDFIPHSCDTHHIVPGEVLSLKWQFNTTLSAGVFVIQFCHRKHTKYSTKQAAIITFLHNLITHHWGARWRLVFWWVPYLSIYIYISSTIYCHMETEILSGILCLHKLKWHWLWLLCLPHSLSPSPMAFASAAVAASVSAPPTHFRWFSTSPK